MADNNKTSIFEKLTRFVREVFKTTVEIFLEALKASPNAQGYVIGSITELLLKKKMETDYGFEVKRTREKWEGRKHSKHHGDYYFRKPKTDLWYVMECKGVKSNSEKWHKLYNYDALKRFLISNADKIPWINDQTDVERQVVAWLQSNLPEFENEYAGNLYEYEEARKYLKNMPKRETLKSQAILKLRDYNRDQIDDMIEERLNYVMSKVKVLETHFVSGTSGVSERTQATPRKDEFNAISIDIVLRYPEHKFLFANPKQLESSGEDPDHLQQNYIMGFVFIDENGNRNLSISEEWYEDFNQVYETISPEDAVDEKDMQIDNRNVIIKENDG